MAGINTAVTAVGTVAGGVALGTGIAKANVDVRAEELEAELQEEIRKLNELAATQTHIDMIPDFDPMPDDAMDVNVSISKNEIDRKQE